MADYLLLCITNLYLLDELLYLFWWILWCSDHEIYTTTFRILMSLLGVVSSSDLPVVLSGDSK